MMNFACSRFEGIQEKKKYLYILS